MKTSHTPGQWVAFSNDDPGVIQYVDDLEYHQQRVATVTAGNCSFTYVPLSQAKAAPELLAVLQKIVAQIDPKASNEIGLGNYLNARAAIAKATGEA